MKYVEQKRRGRGRPATGQAPAIGLRLSAEEIQLIDEFAAELGIDRSKALRELLGQGYAACMRKKRRAAAAQRRAAAVNAELVAGVLEGSPKEPEPIVVLRRRPGYRRPPTREEIKAAADRAEQRRSR
jgi:hypothetical protein